MTFGAWLRETRRKARMTLEELAEKADCSKNYLSVLERNAPHHKTGALPQPSRKIVTAIALALGEPISDALQAAGYSSGYTYPESPPGNGSEILHEPFADELTQNGDFLGHLGRVYRGLPPGRARDEWKRKLRADADAEAELIRRLVEGDRLEEP
jgi:transcriptional regulator with XRE-family HTH domain